MNTLTVADVQLNRDRMLVKEMFVDMESLTDRQFTVDACCHDSGVNSHCSDYCSPSKSFFKRDLCGQHVWLHAPFGRIGRFLKHYVKCKQRAPQSTSACIVVPAGPVAKQSWRKYLSGMKLLKRYDEGSMLFTQAGLQGNKRSLGPSPWDIEIWHDPPAAEMHVPPLPELSMCAASGDA